VADLAPTNASSRPWGCQRTDPTFTDLVGSGCPNSSLVKTARHFRVSGVARAQVLTWLGGGGGSTILMWTVWLRATLQRACVCNFGSFCFGFVFGFIHVRLLKVLAARSASQHGRRGKVHICSVLSLAFQIPAKASYSLLCICEAFRFWKCQNVQACSAV
jgi:hypothetical protein